MGGANSINNSVLARYTDEIQIEVERERIAGA